MNPLLPEQSAWEAKLRAKQVQAETPEARAWRGIAEATDTTAQTLLDLWDTVTGLWVHDKSSGVIILVCEAIAAHPNAPPELLVDLPPVCARAFCLNPIAPLILLEMPTFAQRLLFDFCTALLREDAAPPALITTFAQSRNQELPTHEAKYHIAFAGAVESQTEWETALDRYWKDYCAGFVPPRHDADRNEAHWHCDLAELHLAPQWLQKPPYFLAADISPSPDATQWLCFSHAPGSPEEAALWKKIAPAFRQRPRFIESARQNATANDLVRLLSAPGGGNGVLHEVIASHPAARDYVLRALLRQKPSKTVRGLIAQNPHAPTAVLTVLAQDNDPLIRRVARQNPSAPPNLSDTSRQAALHPKHRAKMSISPLVNFAATLHNTATPTELAKNGQEENFELRLAAALGLPNKPVPIDDDPANRTCADLLAHLARDGNRFVRWAAQTRLDNSDFVFTWAEETQ